MPAPLPTVVAPAQPASDTLNWDAANDDADGYKIMRRRRFLGEKAESRILMSTIKLREKQRDERLSPRYLD